ncbi:MAG: hypothetical protein FDZ69_04570 [Deltaproteobacteria bacterium]|nr:MAG: hypothetical protein FDZ69_04570 [Deltaproteobacteria bacterium]
MSLFRDRITRTDHQAPKGTVLYGRWQLRPGDRPVFLNSVRVADGDLLVSDLSRDWRLTGLDGLAGAGTYATGQYPEQIEAGSINAIGCKLSELVDQGAGWFDWLEISPLVPGLAERVAMRPLDIEIGRELCHLEEVCRRPRAHLRVEIERVNVSQSRRIPNNAAAYLAEHTEDWERPTLRSVVPKRILSQVRYDQLDIYENRVCVRLADLILEYLLSRINELRRLEKMFVEASDSTFSVSKGSTWGRARRIYSLWGKSVNANEGLVQVRNTIKKLETYKRRVAGLKDTELYRAIPRRSSVGTSIKMTNILSNDEHYRHVASLWQAYVKLGVNRQQTPSEIYRQYQELFRNIVKFCFLLTARAFSQLGFEPKACDIAIRRGCSLELTGPSGSCFLSWDEEDNFLVQQGCKQVLRIVPLGSSLVQMEEKVLGDLFGELESPSAGLDSTLLLYPSSPEAFSSNKMTTAVSERIHSLKHDLKSSQIAPLGYLPVSPWDLGSVERVARAIRWSLFRPLYASFPLQIKEPQKEFAHFSETKWLAGNGHGFVTLLRPPTEQEMGRFNLSKSVETADNLLQRLEGERDDVTGKLREAVTARSKTEHLNRQKADLTKQISEAQMAKDALESFATKIDESVRVFEALLKCPVCSTGINAPQTPVNLKTGHFECECPSCLSKWGNRICGHCHKSYPVIVLKASDEVANLSPFDWVDRSFGQDVFATPCKDSLGNWTYICPECNHCT